MAYAAVESRHTEQGIRSPEGHSGRCGCGQTTAGRTACARSRTREGAPRRGRASESLTRLEADEERGLRSALFVFVRPYCKRFRHRSFPLICSAEAGPEAAAIVKEGKVRAD